MSAQCVVIVTVGVEVDKNYYHYKECGLDNVWLVSGFEKSATSYGEAVHIANVEGLHKAIGLRIVNQPSRMTGQELRFLRVEMDLSQKCLGQLLKVSDQTVAGWEKEKREIPLATDVVIRALYGESINSKKTRIATLLREIAELDNHEDETWMFEGSEKGWNSAA